MTMSHRARRRLPGVVGALLLAVGLPLGVTLGAADAGAQDEPTTTVSDGVTTTTAEAATTAESEVDTEQLTLGSEVFSSSCASCHQPLGAGLPGQYPKLKGDEKLQDTAYVRETILNGRRGEITVNGETFDSVMPAVSGLSDTDIDALIAYLQTDFAPIEGGGGEVVAADPAATLADGSLPGSITLITTVALLVGLAVGGLVMVPRLASAHDRLETTWLDAWLKTGVIFVGIIVLVLIIPNWIVKMGWFADLDRILQDLIASAIWGVGLVTALWGLWYAHRRDWI